ncbi:hypothetical protein H2203_007082 [Taxawa tesnikishii (nom. ined.)]|nr:hypothetical protein H2203_007082 [Dothideales sp. JES 119]
MRDRTSTAIRQAPLTPESVTDFVCPLWIQPIVSSLAYKTHPSGASTPTDAESPYTSSSGMLFAPPTELEHLALGADTHWRERQSFHFYINITSPQVGGFFGSCFWGDLLIRASYYDSALRHVLIAIGALHEAILRRRHDYSKGVDVAPEFSLRHCNSAIALVSEVQSPQASGAAISLLTICLAITLFEAVQARSIEAMSHALQGVRLMDQFRDATTTATARTHCQPPHAIDPHVLAVVLSQVCYAIRGRSGTPVLDDSIESIELQDPSGIDSIQTACGLLELARNKIVTYCLSDLAKDSSFEAVCETSAKKHGYKVWLQIWEQAFTSFLSRKARRQASMTSSEEWC